MTDADAVQPVAASATAATPLGRLGAAMAISNIGSYIALLTPLQLLLTLHLTRIASSGAAAAFGLVTGLGAFFALVANPLAGRISDRTTAAFGRRRTWILSGALAGAAVLTAMAFTTQVWQVAVVWCLVQALFNFQLAATSALLADQVPVDRRGTVSGFLGLTVAVGPILGIAAASAIADPVAQWVMVAVVAVIAAVVAVVLLRDPRHHAPTGSPSLGLGELARSFWLSPRRHPAFGWAWLVRFLITCAYAAGTYNAFFLIDRFGIAPDAVAPYVLQLSLLSVVLLALASGVSGVISDRLRRQKPFVVAAGVVSATGLALMAFAPTLTVVFVAVGLLGFGTGLFFSIDSAMCVRMLPSAADAGKDFAIINMANTIPQSFVPFIAPALLALGGYPALYLFLAVLGLAGAWFVRRLPELGRERGARHCPHHRRRRAGLNRKDPTMNSPLHTTTTLGDFELLGLDLGEGTPGDLAGDAGDWIPVAVPGGVHEALLAAGRIEHPFYGANERKDSWIETKEWWYRARFAAPQHEPGARVRLRFEGLDTVADVWLNGEPLGHHENQFRPAEFDVAALLEPENTLLVRFNPPLLGREVPPSVAQTMLALQAAFAGLLSESTEQGEPEGMMATLPLATTVRKAAFSWGWDFGPNVPSIGIWRPVRLSVEPGAVLTGHHVAVTDLAEDLSRAAVTVRVEASTQQQLRAAIRLVAPSGRAFEGGVDLVGGEGRTVLEIENPELWWTHDLGEQPLHEVTIELVDGDTVLDRVSDRVGLRTIRVDRSDEPIEGGRLFCFVLNHVPIFARGANWLPPSMFVGSTTASDYRRLVRLARDGNLNMLRVWGGGIYGTDEFYAACDEEGVLVWQDFPFACTDYPSEDPVLQREVALEAEHNVRRLRNRASLALWSGNNEVHMIHLVAGSGLGPGNWGWHFFHEILPDAVARFDGLTTYWPGSPYGEGGPEAINGTQDGDRHTWEVWHGNLMGGPAFANKGEERHYRRYADDTARFVSEFGIHASPELATLRRWIPESELSVHSRTFDLHNKDNPKNKGDELLAVTTGLPSSLVEYVEYTQAVQAEGMAFAIEHYRRRQPLTAGALMWEFNDVWPGFSWSIVDFDGIPKAAYFAASRASAPVAVSLKHLGDGVVEAWLVNNSRVPVELDVDLEVGSFDGTQRAAERVRGAAPASSSARIWTGSAIADAAHYVWASSPAGAFPSARLHFAQVRDLQAGPSRLDVEVLDGALRIRSTGYSYLVRIEQTSAGVRLSDNCFDLRDGDERVISVTGADPGSLSVSSFPLSSDRG